MPNLVALIALSVWPFVVFALYQRTDPVRATVYGIVTGYLLLPVGVGINPPLLPYLNKESIPAISALVGCVLYGRLKISLAPSQGSERWLFWLIVLVPVFTTFTNQEPTFGPQGYIRGLDILYGISTSLTKFISLIPFLLGLVLVRSEQDQIQMFKLLLIIGLIYTLPMLLEIRLSPQLHTWVYGFFPHSFLQTIRYDGFRPVVFLGHGLLVAVFAAIILGVATTLWSVKIHVMRVPSVLIVCYLLGVLVLCKTLGALILGLAMFVLLRYMSVKIMNQVCVALSIGLLLYPILSLLDFFPHEMILNAFESFDPERRSSLEFRFENEALILDHIESKFFFGWGGWGRFLVEGAVSDGYWVILMGEHGIVGFLAVFGLLYITVRKAQSASRYAESSRARYLLVSHVVIVSVAMVDQIPNDSMNNFMWLLIGSLLGRSNQVLKERGRKKADRFRLGATSSPVS